MNDDLSEVGEPIEEWANPIIAEGPRREFEMEQVLPGEDSEDLFSDPITESNERHNGEDVVSCVPRGAFAVQATE